MDNTSASLVKIMKQDLWERFGSGDHPAEWDGKHFGGGGGKLSQRFWEYFKTIEHLQLTKDSVVLDIGGWSNDRGAGFFGRILAQYIKKVIIMDPTIQLDTKVPDNITLVKDFAAFETLKNLFEAHHEITHVSCVSVFEHIEPAMREGIVKAVNDHFRGDIFVASYEYHTKGCHFEHQLTVKTASQLFEPLTKFFPTAYEHCPSLAENSYVNFLFRGKDKKVPKIFDKMFKKLIPLWYPVIIKFERGQR